MFAIFRYRNAGREVINVLKKHCNKIERASVDEAYLDITQIVENRMAATSTSSIDLLEKLSNTYVVGYSECDDNNEGREVIVIYNVIYNISCC